MYGFGGTMAHANGLDGAARTGGSIAGGKDAGVRGGGGLGVVLDGAAARDADVVGKVGQGGTLADGHDDGIGGHGVIAAFDGQGATASRSIGRTERHIDQLDARSAALSREDAHRIGQQIERHALVFGLIDLERISGHLGAGAAVDDSGLGPQAAGAAGGIDGGVAAAHDDHMPADVGTFSGIDAMQKVDGRIDPGLLLALDAEGGRVVGADADEHGVVLAEQRVGVLDRAVDV